MQGFLAFHRKIAQKTVQINSIFVILESGARKRIMRIAVERSPCYPQEPEQTDKSRLDPSAPALEGKPINQRSCLPFPCLRILGARADDSPDTFPGLSSGFGVACD